MLMFVMTHTQFCCLVWSFYSWSTICTWQCCHSVGFLTLKFSVWILSIDVWFFIIRKLFDISCVSHHVQPISKLPSVALAECGHFVVTWSVQCGHLVCAGIFLAQSCFIMWSHWSQQNEAQRQTRNFYINFTFNSAIQCSSKTMNLNRTLN